MYTKLGGPGVEFSLDASIDLKNACPMIPYAQQNCSQPVRWISHFNLNCWISSFVKSEVEIPKTSSIKYFDESTLKSGVEEMEFKFVIALLSSLRAWRCTPSRSILLQY